MTVMGPPITQSDPKQEADIATYGPDAICGDPGCGHRADDPIHNTARPETPPKGEPKSDTEDPTGNGDGDEDEDGTEDGTEDGGGNGDGDEEDDDDDEPGSDGGDEPGEGGDKEGNPTGNGGGNGEGKVNDGPLGELPTESGQGGGGKGASATGSNVPQDTLEALQRAVDEYATLEGDPAIGKGQVLRNLKDVPKSGDRWGYGNGETYPQATAAIRAAFMRSKTGNDERESGYRTGRLAENILHRIAETGEDRLFSHRNSPSIDRFNLWVMVDCSSSMSGPPIAEATAVAKAFATATNAIGSIRTSVWGWSNAFAPDLLQQVPDPTFGAVLVYHGRGDTGTIDILRQVKMGGTPDAATLAWAIDAIRKDSAPAEKPIIVMVSDGQGADLTAQTSRAKRVGVRVVGVNIGEDWHSRYNPAAKAAQDERLAVNYGGRDNYIGWQGSVAAMAGPLGRLIAKAITPH